MAEKNKIKDESGDRNYFVMTPLIVYLQCDIYEQRLWETIKIIAGDNGGECCYDTRALGILSNMSKTKVHDVRKTLLEKGFLVGQKRQDAGYPQPVWHLKIPNLWKRNTDFMSQYDSPKKMYLFKLKEQQDAKAVRHKDTKSCPPQGRSCPPQGQQSKKSCPPQGRNINNTINKEIDNTAQQIQPLFEISEIERWGKFSQAVTELFSTRGQYTPFCFTSPGRDKVSTYWKDVVLGKDKLLVNDLLPMIEYFLDQNPNRRFDGFDLYLAMNNGLPTAYKAQEPYHFDKDEILSGNRMPKFLQGNGEMNLATFMAGCKATDRVYHVLAEVADTMNKGYETRQAWRSWVETQLPAAKKLAAFSDKQIDAGMNKLLATDFESWSTSTLLHFTTQGELK